MSTAAPEKTRPPRDDLYRGLRPHGCELRAEGEGDDEGPVMVGHFAVFDQWTEICSIFEGHFLERFAPGAFKKTIAENLESMRVLFQHGFDPMLDEKPLGPIRSLEEDSEGDHADGVAGVWYEVPLLDASYVRDQVLPGLEKDLYGASMRFRVIREEFDREPGESEHNPDGLPERTVKEAQVREFGPVTFPAYEGASAGIRSLTDEFLVGRFARDPEKLEALIRNFISPADEEARAAAAAEKSGDEKPSDEADRNAGKERTTAPSKASAGDPPHPDTGERRDSGLFGLDAHRKGDAPPWRL